MQLLAWLPVEGAVPPAQNILPEDRARPGYFKQDRASWHTVGTKKGPPVKAGLVMKTAIPLRRLALLLCRRRGLGHVLDFTEDLSQVTCAAGIVQAFLG